MDARLHAPARHFSERSAIKKGRMVATAESRFITGNVGNNVTPYIANLVGRDRHHRGWAFAKQVT